METVKISIDSVEYRHFRGRFSAGDFGSQRLGQAVSDYFKLHKSKVFDKPKFQQLYYADNEESETLIKELFEFS